MALLEWGLPKQLDVLDPLEDVDDAVAPPHKKHPAKSEVLISPQSPKPAEVVALLGNLNSPA